MSSTQNEMWPSHVAQHVLEQHESLGCRLEELSKAARSLRSGGVSAFDHAHALARSLYNDIKHHLAFENTFLLPALRQSDAWGLARASMLASRLRTRRRELADLRAAFAGEEAGALAKRIDRFVVERRADMAHQRRHVLSSSVLRDDVHGIDVDGG